MGFTATVVNYDPYRKFKFLVKLDGSTTAVAGVSKISAITKHVDPVDWRTGGDPNTTAKVPGLTKYEPITLERGLSANKDFIDWMYSVNRYQAASGTEVESVHTFRKNLLIEVYNLANELVMSITVYRAWPSKLTVADFDAKANELAIEVLELQHEGWDITQRLDSPTEERKLGHVVLAPDLKRDVALLFGLPDGRGRRARRAVLVPLNGRGELRGADEPNPFRAALDMLAASAHELGPFRAGDVDPGVLAALLPLDRDFLLVQLNRLTFGDTFYQTVVCPAEGCGKRVDVQLDLSQVTPAEPPTEVEGRLALPDGREVHYRLPTAGDQAALFGLPADELEAAFLARCTRGEGGVDEVLALPAELRAAIVREVVAASPELDLTLDLACVECGQPFRFTYDPVSALLGELRASRSALLKEVHYLAFYYHWSQAEILGLSRSLRREYLGLLEEELERQRGTR